MNLFRHGVAAGVWLLGVWAACAQIDPVKRELIQLGYNQPLQGVAPLSGYAFYYLNIPSAFHQSNLALRVTVAPVYLDTELGIRGVLTPHTDLGIGLAGGGFADSYHEIRRGEWFREESFDGHGARVPVSLYHCFNPAQRVPLNGLLRAEYHYSTFGRASDTAPGFRLPSDQNTLRTRAGLRLGGSEPVLLPELAMELSVWYEGEHPLNPCDYGYNGDRRIEAQSHFYHGRAMIAYTFPQSHQRLALSINGGGSIHATRLNTYRLGGLLPFTSEFPMSLPGYFYQELSAEHSTLFAAEYLVPLDRKRRVNLMATAASALVDYMPGFDQSNAWNSGVGGGVTCGPASGWWQAMLCYGYGIDAIRSESRGGHSIGLLVQFDLDRANTPLFNDQGTPLRSKGLQNIFRGFRR